MRARLGLAALVVTLALAAGGCGGSAEPIRIGVLSDCFGFFGAYNDIVLAGLELPLLERGARLAGRKPSDGIVGAKIAGRPVEVRVACSGATFFNTLIEQTRRLVEIERVDVVIGPTWGPTDGFVVRDLAERYPDVAFVAGVSLAPEEALCDPAPNLFRFTPDYAQQTAGLGSYAYRELGWRTAAIVASDWSPVWPRVAGFAAEFCALGGRILDRMWRPEGAPIGTEVAASVPRNVDGVALFPESAFLDWSGFARGYGKRHPDLARRLVVGPEGLDNALARGGDRLAGVVTAMSAPYEPGDPAWRRFGREYRRNFPGLPLSPGPAGFPLVIAYYTAMEAVVRALGEVDGKFGDGETRFRAALGKVDFESPDGRVLLDRNRQAVAPTYLSRVETDGKRKPVLRTLRVVPKVE